MAYADGAHLTSLTVGSGTTTRFTYDALGRTATRGPDGGPTETYAYVGTGETIYRITDGTPAHDRTSLIDNAGSRLTLTTGTTTRFSLFDHLGSLVGLVDPSGSLAEVYRFDGYGQALPGTTQASKDAAARNPFRFRGAVNLATDAEPLYEMGARLYAPSAGAWTSLDTYAGSAQDPRTMNRFVYAASNPAGSRCTHMIESNDGGLEMAGSGPVSIERIESICEAHEAACRALGAPLGSIESRLEARVDRQPAGPAISQFVVRAAGDVRRLLAAVKADTGLAYDEVAELDSYVGSLPGLPWRTFAESEPGMGGETFISLHTFDGSEGELYLYLEGEPAPEAVHVMVGTAPAAIAFLLDDLIGGHRNGPPTAR